MFARWNDFDRALTVMDDLMRRRLEHYFDTSEGRALFAEQDRQKRGLASSSFSLNDKGAYLMLRAVLPGMSEKELNLSINQDVISLAGERKPDSPEGYTVHRQERSAAKFARSFTLPCKVDAERATATIKNGILTVKLPKAPEAQPRQISVQAQA